MVVFRSDPCGFFCICMTYGAVLYADYVVVKWIVLQILNGSIWGSLHVVLFNTIIFLLFLSHARAVFSDPGIVPLPKHRLNLASEEEMSEGGGSIKPREDWTICTRCEMYRPPRAHHCRICKQCIRKMDHHCPWINNCVGEWNQKFFIQFLMYVGLLSVYAICLVAYSWYAECSTCSKELMVRQSRILHSVLLVMESLLFGMFVIAISCDQFDAIFSDETLVEQVKHRNNTRELQESHHHQSPHAKPKLKLLAEVFGRTHPLLWLFPCSVNRTRAIHPIPDLHV
eukprot:TRINITY_DN2493_c0_g1_i1.p1 TRINITY_DN2493_c0_g1~~TRINITY_DN2493_c0_g1_i1.p1  ORF type:complete len:284 (-),score=19.15 TRINITY_DN2493_c0_g1_i1:219-1070(-)